MKHDTDELRTHKHHHHHRNKKRRRLMKWVLGILAFVIIIGAAGAIKIYTDTKSAIQSTYKQVKHKDIRKGAAADVTAGDPFLRLNPRGRYRWIRADLPRTFWYHHGSCRF